MDAYEKLFLKLEAQRKLEEKADSYIGNGINKDSHIKSDQIAEDKKISANTAGNKIKPQVNKDVSLVQTKQNKTRFVKMKALKFSKELVNKRSESIKIRDTLDKNILIIDDILEGNRSRTDLLTTIKDRDVKFIIAPGYANGFYEKAADLGLNLLKCDNAKLIDDGNDIEVYMQEGVIFDVSTGQEYKFNPAIGTDQRCVIEILRTGECLRIGNEVKLKVLNIDRKQIKLFIYDSKVITVFVNKGILLSDDIKIKVVKIDINEFKIQIVAPEYMAIKKSWSLKNI